jgi:DNA-binding IclR family transcriptional regulator
MAYDEHRTVDRVVSILELLANNSEGISFSEISRILSMPKSSLHPVLHTLCKRRLVHFKTKEQKYVLGDLMFSLGSNYVADSSLLNKVDGLLSLLTEESGETCHFGVLSGNEVLYLLKQSPASPVHVAARSGYRLGAYCTAIGKALLSQFSKEELFALYPNGLKPITPHTVEDVDSLWLQLEEIRKNGWGYEKEESSIHVQCLSAPVFCQQKIIAATSVAFPIFQFNEETEKMQFIRKCLANTCRKIEDVISQNIADWIYGS